MPADTAEPQTETERVLTGLARGRFGRIAPELIGRHVLAATPEAEWPVQRAALDALARRYAFGVRDGLTVAERPATGMLGEYATRASGEGKRTGARPYRTALLSLDPIRASCSCADFVRSSLGLCKHALAVLDALHRSGKRLQGTETAAEAPKKARLVWSFAQPLRGQEGRLARLQYVHAGRAQVPAVFASERARGQLLARPESTHDVIVDLERRVARGVLEAEPAVVTLLAEEKARAAHELALGDARAPLKQLATLKRKLYPYQREGVKRFFETGRLLLADDMGLGKTTQAIAACHGLFEAGRIRRGLLIVPAPLKPQWKREWEATSSVPITLVDGSPEERARIYASTKTGFLVMGYEQLLRDLERVQGYAPELVVLDEAQRIKNWATKSAAYVKTLSPAYRLVLTGTPMENRFDELASIMDFVDDLALEPKWRIVPFHQIQAGDGGKGVGGAQNLDVLRARLSGSMLRRLRNDVLKQLPTRTDTRVPVELTSAQREPHDELMQPIAELMSVSARRPLQQSEFLRLMQLLTTQRMLCNGLAQLNFEEEWPRCQSSIATPQLLDSLFAPKLGVLRGLIDQLVLTQRRKVVVFSQWRAMLKLSEWAVRDLLASKGLRAAFFTGAESAKQRERAVVDFHDDPSVAVLFLSDAGGVGLNLQRAASACINLELPWNPAVLEQRIGRIHRLGQTLPIDVYNLVSEEGIEARIATLLGQKKAVFSALFDGQSDQVQFDGQSSFMESVKTLVGALPPGAASARELETEMDVDLPRAEDDTMSEREAVVEAAAPSPAMSAAPPGLRVSRLEDGGLRIDAPPELAAPLASLLEALAQALRGQGAQNSP